MSTAKAFARQLRLLDKSPRSVRVGDVVTCTYRHDHRGTVLDRYDVRAWRGSIALGDDPTEEAVREHVNALSRNGFTPMRGGIDNLWTRKAPVLWDFGKVFWDDVSQLRLAQREGKAVTERKPIEITIADDQWEDCSGDRSMLHGPPVYVRIGTGGCLMHMEAHAVRWDGDIQVNDGEASDFASLNAANDICEPQDEVTIAGRQYVLFAHAYS